MKDLLNSDWLSVNFYLDNTNTYEIVHPFQEDGTYKVFVTTEGGEYCIKFIYFEDCFSDKHVQKRIKEDNPLRFGCDAFESVTVEELTVDAEINIIPSDENEKLLFDKLMEV